jgi:hypothetical protein
MWLYFEKLKYKWVKNKNYERNKTANHRDIFWLQMPSRV